ncbi:MAG: long-chain fatty acid--CoA ligase, partial [Polyangiaceae bacterium]|nr:long-chain fatty acid--CoA ligase [Polyangiaceae bacterium]
MQDRNLVDMFYHRAAKFGSRTRFRYCVNDRWRDVTWSELAQLVRHVAAALLEVGVRRGDRVCLMSQTRAEWIEADLGILAAGGVSTAIYPSNTPDETAFILWNAGARVVFVENPAQFDKIRQIQREGFVLPHVEIPPTADGAPQPSPGDVVKVAIDKIIVFDGEGDGGADVMSFAAMAALGSRALAAHQSELRRVAEEVTRDEIATIVYTSGTTGPPKGVVQTHGNHLAMFEMTSTDVGLFEEGDVDFLFLPLAHSFARMQEYMAIYMGSTTAIARSLDTVLDDLQQARPNIIPAVPRVYEKIFARIQSQAESSVLRKRVFSWALQTGRRISRHVQAREPVPLLLAAQGKIAHRLVFKKLHDKLGGRVKYFVSAGAPLSREVAEFFHAAGLLILEGYGLTETTPALCLNRPNDYRFGTVGRPLSQVEVRLAQDGELLARGPNVAKGYYRRPEATKEAWDDEGWFHSGDIAEIDSDGFVRIVDRKKELIITAGGKNVAPQNVENVIKTSPFISGALLCGDRKPYCVVLVTLSVDEITAWAEKQGKAGHTLEQLGRDPDVVRLIEREIEARKAKLASFETPKKFAIVYPDFTQETGELT